MGYQKTFYLQEDEGVYVLLIKLLALRIVSPAVRKFYGMPHWAFQPSVTLTSHPI